MLEVVVTIMIVGILAAIAREIIPDMTLLKETSYLLTRIKETQSDAILEEESKCLDMKNSAVKKSILKVKDGSLKSLCFDEEGKPYENNTSTAQLVKKPLSISLTYKKEKKEIVVMPYSGLVTIR